MTDKITKISLNVNNVVVNGPALEIGEMDRAGFEELGIKLKTIQGHTVLWWGDWGNAFKEQHGWGSVKQVAELLEMNENYIMECMGTAETYKVEVRTSYLEQGLSSTHLLEARAAPSPEFALDRAVEYGWSKRELRAEIQAMRPASKEEKKIMFQWIRDSRVIWMEEAFLTMANIVEDLQTATEDHAVAAIMLTEWSIKCNQLKELIDD